MIHLSHHESDWFPQMDRAGTPICDTAGQASRLKLAGISARVYWASTANMARRLTTPAPAWRDDFVAAA